MAKFVTNREFIKDEKLIKVPEHEPDDLLIIYRKALKGSTSPPYIQGWDNQAFVDRAGNHHVLSWVIDRLGTIDEVDNENPKPYNAFLSIYRGVTVGEISIDDLTRYDPGPFVDSDAVETHKSPGTVLNSQVHRVTLLDLPNKRYQRVWVDFKFKSDNYFTANGHVAMVARCDLSFVNRAVRGHGMVFGDVAGATDPSGDPDYAPNPIVPSTQIESWMNGTIPGRGQYLLNGNPNPPVLRDGVEYRVRLETFISSDRVNQTVRYTIHVGSTLVYDSGVVIDPNRHFDPSCNNLVIGHVFSSPKDDWSVHITDVVQRMSD